MDSDTPRTDAKEWIEPNTGLGWYPSEGARQLERELSAAQSQIAALKADAERQALRFTGILARIRNVLSTAHPEYMPMTRQEADSLITDIDAAMKAKP